MFKWFSKAPKLNIVEITQEAKDILLDYLEHGDHSKLIPVFRESIIDREDAAQYLMTEIHIGSLMQKLHTNLTEMDLEIYDGKITDDTRLNTIFINSKHIVDVPKTIFVLVYVLTINLDYIATTKKHLPYTLGGFISESSTI